MKRKAKPLEICLVCGPNLNLLGEREPQIYGSMTLTDIRALLNKEARQLKVKLSFFQSNHEGELIDFIQKKRKTASGFLVNFAAYTHTSIALRDTMLAVQKPFVEVHLSDLKTRESFRQFSYFSDIAVGVCMGKKEQSFVEGLRRIVEYLNHNSVK